MFNLFTCGGWEETGFITSCSISWLMMALLFYIVFISRKQIGENLGLYEYNLMGGIAGAYLPFIIIVTIFGSWKWGFIAGVLGSLLGSYFGGLFFGGSEGGGDAWY